MMWITISIAMAGSLSGFLAGASPKATGGELSSMIGGVIVGVLAGLSQSKALEANQITELGKFFSISIVSTGSLYPQ